MRVREEAVLAFERRDCWEGLLERREGCVGLEVVGRRGASVKGSWWDRLGGGIVVAGSVLLDIGASGCGCY